MVIHGMGLGAQQVLVPLCMRWGDRGTVLPRPLQHLQMSTTSGIFTRVLVPRAVVLPRPFEHV
jgi:hypothetical protein